jgi:putative serine protease PepD
MVLGGFLAVNLTDGTEAPPAATATAEATTSGGLPVADNPQTPIPSGDFSAVLPQIVDEVRASVVRVSTSSGDGVFSAEGLGSGVVVDQDGHILTNFHVVQGASTVTVQLADGTVGEGTVVGTDPANDLAVVRTTIARDLLVPAEFADSDAVRVGEPVFAIGNPFSLDFSVTSGIVSAVERERAGDLGRSIRGVIQTDAAVNPGNSGGPLFNAAGQVIGINTSIENPTGQRVFVGIGFAVPSNMVLRFLPQMIAGETVRHPQLGISGVTLNTIMAGDAGVATTDGVYVTQVPAGTAADIAGLAPASVPDAGGELLGGGDVITHINGETVLTIEQLASMVDRYDVGETITLTVLRDGQELELVATLQEWE